MSLNAVGVPCLHPFLGSPLICLAPLQVSTVEELEDTATSGQKDANAPNVLTLRSLGLPQPDFHSLILDLGTLSFVDTVCIKNLKNVRGSEARASPPSLLTPYLSKRPLSLLSPQVL